jgi:hypothetical protein
MVIHPLACWLFMNAFKQLGFLHDYKFIEGFILHDYNKLGHGHFKGLDMNRIMADIHYDTQIAFAGLLIGFGISVMLSWRYKWYWVNSVTVLLITLVLSASNRFHWHYVNLILNAPGRIFKPYWAFWLTNGLVMLTMGLLLFFLKPIIRFINKRTDGHTSNATGNLNPIV